MGAIFSIYFSILNQLSHFIQMQNQPLFFKLRFLLFLLPSIFFFQSCENISFQNGIKEGKIEYNISYPRISEDNVMLDMMPKKMRTTFSKNSYRSDIMAGMGLFKTSIICKEGDSTLIHSIKMLKDKYASKVSEADFDKLNPSFNNVKVKLNDEKKEIAGYHCKGADISILGDSTWGFKLFYTNEIKIKNANGHTPFKLIDGVLMEYELVTNNVHMRFEATKVIQEDIDPALIDLEDDYKMIPAAELQSEIDKLFSNIM